MAGTVRDPDGGDLLLVAAGDGPAMDRLVAQWARPVYQVYERTREPSAAVEATAEVFLELRATAQQYEPGLPFPVWLFRIAARLMGEGSPAPQPIPLNRLRESAAARASLLRSSVAALPRPERAALLLTRVARLPLADAARALEVSEPELRRLLVRAFDRLQHPLDPLLQGVAPPAATEESP
jgi:DNA-directed RNA polymerase specialized sigma24 family protein